MTLERLTAYLAMDRRHHLARGEGLPNRFTGAALLADISGFTPLTEALAEQLGPRRGAEELTGILNAVYTDIVDCIHSFGGSVVCFIGDAIIACFPEDGTPRALVCGFDVQRVMERFKELPLPQGGAATLAMKAIVTEGPMRRFLVGDPSIRLIDVLAGETVDRLSDGEHLAQPGEVIASPEVVARWRDVLSVAEQRGSHAVLREVRHGIGGSEAKDAPIAFQLDTESLRSYLLPPVFERLLGGHGEFLSELRPVAALFLKFSGIDYDGDDDAGEKLGTFTSWVQGQVDQFGGHVLLLTTADKGSHLYAVFGALEAHEDDCARAIAAAHELQQVPASLEFIQDVRIGVSFGRARVGAYGGKGRRTYGALGNVVNRAARLMGIAPPGQIRCSQSVVDRAHGRWTFEALDAVELKGLAGPQSVYRPTGRMTASATPRSPLVGRTSECSILFHSLKDAEAGSRRICILEGEAGIGKSRLVTELITEAESKGFTCLVGTGDSIEQHTAYSVWRDVLDALFDLDGSLDLDVRQSRTLERIRLLDPEAERHCPLLNDILGLGFPETATTANYTPEVRQESLAAWLSHLLATVAREHPLLIILDDAHWLDSLSWDLAVSVAQGLVRSPMCLVATHRPFGDLEPHGLSVLASLSNAQRIRLTALPEQATLSVAATHVGLPPDALPPEIRMLVLERAGGNPFYARELVRALLDTGRVIVEGAACRVTADADALRESVPDTLEGVVLARLDRLPSEEQLTMRAASVIGRSFLFRTLESVHPASIDRAELRTHLDDTTRHLFTLLEAEKPELLYAFQHVVTQHATYDTLLFEQRRDLHCRVAAWYENAYTGNLPPYYAVLAFHWNRAGKDEEEYRYVLLAGEQAARQYANTEAELHLTRALDLIERIGTGKDDPRRYRILRMRATVLALLGKVEEERADLSALLELAERSGELSKRGSVLDLWTDFHNRCGQFAEALACGEEALTAMNRAGDRAGEARALTRLAKTFEEQGDFEQARSYAQSALAIFREAGDLGGEASSLKSLGIICARSGDLAKAMERFQAAQGLFRQAGDRKGEAEILGNLGALSYYLGDYEATIRYTERAQPMFEDMGNQSGSARCLSNLGSSYSALGAFGEGLSFHERSAALYQQLEDENGFADSCTNMGNACQAMGVGGYPELTGAPHQANENLTNALRYYRTAMEISARIGSKPGEVLSYFNLGSTYLCLGETEEAVNHLRQAIDLAEEVGLEAIALRSLAGLARAALQEGNVDEALARSAAAASKLAEQPAAHTDEITFTRYRALKASGRDGEAREALQRAAESVLTQSAAIERTDLKAAFLGMHHEILHAADKE